MADLRESILSEGRNLGCEACFWHVSVWTAAYHQVKQNLLLMFCQILNAVCIFFLGSLLRQRPHPPRLPPNAVGLRARLHLQSKQQNPRAHLQEPRRPRPVQAQRGHQLQDRRAAAPVLQHPVLPQAAKREAVPGEVGNLQHIIIWRKLTKILLIFFRYFGENYKQLKLIKDTWDPDNLFNHCHSIGSKEENCCIV